MKSFLCKYVKTGIYFVHNSKKDMSKYIGTSSRISFGKEFFKVIQVLEDIN